MNFRHAAALASVGWYLMIPPAHDFGGPPKTSLSQWDQVSAFDTATACEASLSDLWDCAQELRNNPKGGAACEKIENLKTLFVDIGAGEREKLVYRLANVRCVATDDPRLAK